MSQLVRMLERQEEFREAVGSVFLPIVSPLPVLLLYERFGVQLSYMVDVKALTPEQTEGLARMIARNNHIPLEVALDQLAARGVPIRTVQCEVVHGTAYPSKN